MATGKAIVAPDQPNIRELLEDNVNALLFEPSDQQSFIDACQKLVTDEQLRKRLATKAAASIFENDLLWDANAETIVQLAQFKCND